MKSYNRISLNFNSYKFYLNRILYLAVFFSSLFSYGSLSGYVYDNETQQPLPGSNIIIDNLDIGASCDINGYFIIKNVQPGSYSISASRIGYRSSTKVNITVNSNRQTPIKFLLDISAIQGQEIITKSDYFETIQDAVVSSHSIDRSEIRSDPVGAYDIQMMVHSLPSVITGTDQNNEIIVRGGGPSENLFVVDNLEIPNPNHFGEVGTGGGPVNIINTEFVEKINFLSGGFPSKYGDKQSSVMDISLRDGSFNKIELDLEMSMAGIGFLIEGPILNNKVSFMSSYRKSFIKDLIKSAGLVSVPEYANTQHKITYNINGKNKLMFNFIGGKDNIKIKDENRPDLRGAENVNYAGHQYTYGLTLRSLFSEKGYLLFSLGKTLSSWKAEVYKINSSYVDTFFYRNNLESDNFFKADFVYKYSKNIKLSSGINIKQGVYRMEESLDADTVYLYSYPNIDSNIDLYNFIDYDDFNSSFPNLYLDNFTIDSVLGINPEFTNNQSGKLWKYSAYSQVKFNLDAHVITAGARYDNVPYNTTSTFSPRFSYKFDLNYLTSIKASVGRFYQSPSYWKLLNPNNQTLLKHSFSDHYVIGIDRYLADDLRLTLEAYYKNIKNRSLLYSDVTSNPNDMVLGFVDSGEGRSSGFELFIQKKFSKNWYGTASYSYSNSTAKDYREGKTGYYPWDYDVRNSITMVGGYKVSFKEFNWYRNYKKTLFFKVLSFIPFAPSDQLEVSFRSRYSDGLPFTPKIYNFYHRRWSEDSNGSLNSSKRSYYYRFDIMIMRRFNFKNFNLTTFVDVQNIFNRSNEWERVYLDDGTSIMSYQYKQIPVAGLIVEF